MKKKISEGAGVYKLFAVVLISFFLMMGFPPPSPAAEDVEEMKKQLQTLSEMMKSLQEKLDRVEKQNASKESEITEIDKRLNKAELHTASDRVSLGVDLRTEAQSIQYEDVRVAPPALINAFFAPPPQGFNGATQQQIQQAMAGMKAAGMVPPPNTYDADNDIIYSTRFRLNMKATVNPHLDFSGRLAAYKVWEPGTRTGLQMKSGRRSSSIFPQGGGET